MKPLSKPFHVAGVQFAKIPPTFTTTPTSKVDIRHNPENKFDPFALEVRIDDTFVGHVPRAEQAAWVYHTLQNIIITPKLIYFDRMRPTHEQISIQFECGDLYATTVLKLPFTRE